MDLQLLGIIFLPPLARHEHITVSSSVNGDSAAPGQDDIEAAVSAATPAGTWYGSQTAQGLQFHVGGQQPAADLTMLTASLQSMAAAMQHLMAENQRLSEQMLKVMQQ